jgi:hypothetical protein
MDVGSGCPAASCNYQFESMTESGGGGQGHASSHDGQSQPCHSRDHDHGDFGAPEHDDDVPEVTLAFIVENQRLWLRIALVIKHYEAVDVSTTMHTYMHTCTHACILNDDIHLSIPVLLYIHT